VVYGGIGKAARNWDCFDAILASAAQPAATTRPCWCKVGKPVGVFRTHADAPRVLIANSNLVPQWATWEHFHELDSKGLMMYGQMTAGSLDLHRHARASCRAPTRPSWRPAGSTSAATWPGSWILTAGLGGMGGAQPLAATFAGAVSLDHRVPAKPHRLPPEDPLRGRAGRRDLDDALARIDTLRGREQGRVGRPCWAMPPTLLPELVRRARPAASRPDIVTDQTSAHDLVNGYLPAGWTRGAVAGAAQADATQHAALRLAAAQALRRACAGHAGLPGHGHSHAWTTATTSARWRWTRA